MESKAPEGCRVKIFYPGAKGGPFGWGVFGQEITKQLSAMGILADSIDGADVCLMPLADHDFAPATGDRAKINCAVSFFEYPLGPNAAANAAKYDIVFVGSTWCLDRLKERGITNGQVLIQGVDHSIFYPRTRQPDGKFKIFSGGKFEYRKGQDLVIAAFREFSKSHPDAHLVCSWFNPWPELINGMFIESAELKPPRGGALYWEQEDFFRALLESNGIPSDRFTILPQLSHNALAEAMAQTDCGLFPNRCEGGTNLVLMEYAACGRPVVANRLTGHRDVADLIEFNIQCGEDESHWAAQNLPDITAKLNDAYSLRSEPKYWETPTPAWRAAAQTVANAIARLPVAV